MATLVYEGDCSFCTRLATWLAARARPGLEVRASKEMRELLHARGLLGRARETILWLDGPRTLTESAAAVRALWMTRRGWPLLGGALWLMPKPLRDWGYRWVARRWGPVPRSGD